MTMAFLFILKKDTNKPSFWNNAELLNLYVSTFLSPSLSSFFLSFFLSHVKFYSEQPQGQSQLLGRNTMNEAVSLKACLVLCVSGAKAKISPQKRGGGWKNDLVGKSICSASVKTCVQIPSTQEKSYACTCDPRCKVQCPIVSQNYFS